MNSISQEGLWELVYNSALQFRPRSQISKTSLNLAL